MGNTAETPETIETTETTETTESLALNVVKKLRFVIEM
jgi:hypothetical protein